MSFTPVEYATLAGGFRFLRMGGAGPPRLVVLPYAGGTGLAARALFRHMPPGWALYAADPPGAGFSKARPFDDAEALSQALFRALDPLLDEDTVVYGHSLGGLAAYLLARQVEAGGRRLRALVIAAVRGPRRVVDERWSQLDDGAFIAKIDAIDGVPPALRAAPELLASLLPAVRAGFRAMERFQFTPAAKLESPLLALAAPEDPYVAPDRVAEWIEHGRRARFATVPGRHFFLESHPEALARVLTALAPGA